MKKLTPPIKMIINAGIIILNGLDIGYLQSAEPAFIYSPISCRKRFTVPSLD
jgi:hypothetical protein